MPAADASQPSTETPSVVYHYTSLSSLMGIIETDSIWATNLRYLNDASENQYCWNLLRHHVGEYELQHTNENVGPVREALMGSEPRTFDTYPYVASFSKDDNSLPQWRSYCEHGNGVCIGFRAESLGLADPPPTSQKGPAGKLQRALLDGPRLEMVTYLEEDINRKLDHLIRTCILCVDVWEANQRSLPAAEREPLHASDIAGMFIDYQASLVKHAGFSAEKEYRLIISNPLSTGISFRVSKTTLIPYLPLLMPMFLKAYYIKSVRVGPTPNPELTEESLKNLFRSKNVNVDVLTSNIPFRDL